MRKLLLLLFALSNFMLLPSCSKESIEEERAADEDPIENLTLTFEDIRGYYALKTMKHTSYDEAGNVKGESTPIVDPSWNQAVIISENGLAVLRLSISAGSLNHMKYDPVTTFSKTTELRNFDFQGSISSNFIYTCTYEHPNTIKLVQSLYRYPNKNDVFLKTECMFQKENIEH